RTPTRWNLSKKGFEVPSLLCPLCNISTETSAHLFWTCSMANSVWRLVFKWIDLPLPDSNNLNAVFDWLDHTRLNSAFKIILHFIFGVAVWMLWQFRKNKIFGDKKMLQKDLLDQIIDVSFLTKEDAVAKISTSVFITNFSESFSAKELFHSCKQYGHVVDSFIPTKRSKSGKRFGFVRFINVFNKERLVNNLCTVWIDRYKLQANIARFHRPPVNGRKHLPKDAGRVKSSNTNAYMNDNVSKNVNGITGGGNSYINVVKGQMQPRSGDSQAVPAVVLDDECLLSRDLSKSLLGRVKEFESLANLKMALSNEGFVDINNTILWVELHINAWVERRCVSIRNAYALLFVRLVPDFVDESDDEDQNDNDSKDGGSNVHEMGSCGGDSDVEEVPVTLFEKEFSRKYPSGFTPNKGTDAASMHMEGGRNDNVENLNDCNMEEANVIFSGNRSTMNSKDDGADSVRSGHFKKSEIPRTGGSILSLLDELVKVGQVMGYNMDGCKSNMAEIITSQGAEEVESRGRYILCVWDPNSFCKSNATILDYFVMVRGVWRLTGQDLLMIAVYAPHDFKDKQLLWDYLTREIGKWKGEVVIMGDFNEVDLEDVEAIIDNGNGNEEVVNKRAEIVNNLQNCGTDKAPGPDGFTFDFYRRFWYIIECDVYDAVKHFFTYEDIPKGCNSSFIALIPKIPGANLVKDFRPISLIGSLYKIIAKILANRLVGVLGDIVNEVQSAFIADRQILDGPFILNEVLQWCKVKKKQSLIFKVDFEKAYDSVRWDFLDDVLSKFGFGEKWRKWIQCCLRSSRGSIIINGSPTEEFQFCKGLKQGDPLSPFLFILIMESLHLSFQRVVDAGMFKGIKLGASVNISHMFYADDAVFVGQWCESNISTLVHVLECFYRASGLRINMSKSKIMGVYVDSDKVKRAALKLGCLILKPPFLYLGLIVGGSMSRVHAWNEVVERVKKRLSKWKMKTLSIGGRLTLLKSVLGSMPIFHMSIFKVPSGVLRTLESIRSHFFNGHDSNSKKASWVNWKKVLAPKERGGLGVSSLYALNRGLMFKWVWRFYTQDSSLWARVIKAIHGDDGKMGVITRAGSKSCWMNIVHETNALLNKGIDLIKFMRIKLGNGQITSFWEDMWSEGGTLKNRYPRIYALESSKSITVGMKVAQPSLAFSFRRAPRGGVEQEQFDEIVALVNDVILAPISDRWTWTLESSGDFSVASVRKLIDDKSIPVVDYKTRWIKYVPIKVNVHAWKVKSDSLPTRFNISRRGIYIDSIMCAICDKGAETSSHLFFSCCMVRQVVRLITCWWDVPYMEFESYDGWLAWLVNLRLPYKNKMMLEGVFYVMWWHLWTFRNKTIFKAKAPAKALFFDDVV
ncbi:RNA-directed DNA polymerase, eukaryota, partial [Tanacetum coccineum]